MTDDVSPGEVYRRLVDHEQRTDRTHAALDSRITDVAKDSVTVRMWQQAEQDRDREVQSLTQRVDKLEKRPGVAWGWIFVAGTFLIGVVGVLIQAWSAAKGAK